MVTAAMKLKDIKKKNKRRLLLGRKAMTNLDSISKSKVMTNFDIALPTKVRQVKAMVFLEVTFGCESWTIMKTEH